MKARSLSIFICLLFAALTLAGSASAQSVCAPVPANSIVTTIEGLSFDAAIGLDSDRGVAYVNNYSTKTVSVIDLATNAIIDTINLTSGSDGALVLDSFRGKVYVASLTGGIVSVIDEKTNTVTSTINLSATSLTLAIGIDPFRGKVYVGTYPNTISIIDENTDTVINTITNTPAAPSTNQYAYAPQGIGVDPIRGLVWVSAGPGPVTSPHNLYAIDEQTDTITGALIPLNSQSFSPTVDPIRGLVYVPNNGGSVTVVDEKTRAVVATIVTGAAGNASTSVGLDPVTRTAYVSNYGPVNGNNYGGGYISVIDTVTNTITDTITVGGAAGGPGHGVAVDPVRRSVYVTNWKGNFVSVISAGGPEPWSAHH